MYLICIAALLALISWVFPPGGVTITPELRLEFPSLASVVELDTGRKVKVGEILARLENTDSLNAVRDSAAAQEARRKQALLNLQYPGGDKTVLHPFFAELDQLDGSKPAIRVLHYGDSQIEGDRMTSFIRNELQSRFGGSGPGLVAIDPLVPSFSVNISRSSNWNRFTFFGNKDPDVTHTAYGPLASFSRFVPINLPPPPVVFKGGRKRRGRHPMQESDVEFTANSSSYGLARKWERYRLFYGNSRAPVLMKAFSGGQLYATDTLQKEGNFHLSTYTFGSPVSDLTLKFKGRDSPDFYGISLESTSGVIVDNISMRGSAGTLFSQLNQEHLRRFYKELNTRLLIMQFGGNAVPSIRDSAHAASYGRSFGRQLETLKKLIPEVSIIVIGPADMSVKEGAEMVTHPFLEPVRDGIKLASHEAGAAYFDLYEVMGGRNSMPQWLEEGLASADYIHMSPQGAKLLAEAFMNSLMRDYEAYKKGGVQ